MGDFGKKIEMLIAYLSNNSNNENYGDDIYKYIYRITVGFDRDCSSLVAMRVRSTWMLPKKFRYYPLSNLEEMLDNGDTGTYTPELLKLTSSDISDIKVAIEFIEPIFETDKSEGTRLLKFIYEKYQDFRFDTQMKLFLKSKGIDVLELQGEVEILDRLFTLWDREAIPYLKTIEPSIFVKLAKIQDAANKLSSVAKAGLQCKEPTPSSPIFPKELDTPEARATFDRAIEMGLITQEGEFYRWIGEFGERKELAYFIKCFNVSILKKPNEIKENRPRYNSERFTIAPFQRLFNVKTISQEIQKPLKKGGYKKVDSFFK